jgi:hypothetical protein
VRRAAKVAHEWYKGTQERPDEALEKSSMIKEENV